MSESEKDSTVLIRVNIAGFSGEPASLYGAFDHEDDLLLISDTKDYDPGDAADMLKISNQERDTHRDDLVSDDDLQAAIRAFFEMDGLKLLVIGEKAARHNPSNKIERDGVDEGGVRYRISPDITCSQVAVMFACLAASRQRTVTGALSIMEEISAFSV